MENIEIKKVTTEQLEAIKEIATVRENLIHDLGRNQFNQIKLKNEKAEIENYLNELDQRDAELYEQISSEYGKVSVNLETGEITSVS
jgi:hypothetical protein